MDQNSDSVVAVADVNAATPPAPAADDQKAIPAATEENAEPAAETTEQKEVREKSKFQRRLDRHKAATVEARTEARILRERLDKLEAQPKPTQETGEPKREAFESYEAYLEARTDWRTDQKLEAREKATREAQAGKERQQQESAGTEKVAKEWAEREKVFEAVTKDYAAVVDEFTGENGEMQVLSKAARMAIVKAGPELLYYLGKHPGEAERLADLSAEEQVMELGAMRAKAPVAAKKTTNAPAPASTTNGGRSSSKDPSKMDQREYEEYRKTQGARLVR